MKQLPRILPFTKEHDDFRAMAADFFDQEVAPHHEQWEKDGIVPREIWAKAGSLGLICPNFPEEYGGAGADFLYNLIVIEESARVGASGFFISLHADVIAPYVLHHASDEQKQRWLPGIIDGTKILAIAMTEPGAGSDLAGITSTAIDKGDHYLVNGSKTFISNGYLSDLSGNAHEPEALEIKRMPLEGNPFRRLMYKVKSEIIKIGVPVDVSEGRGTFITPQQLHNMLENHPEEVLMLDVRNAYEKQAGTFINAVDYNIETFSDLPEAARQKPLPADRTVVTFCTGGIRCEKAVPYLRSIGYTDVLQIEGGIWRYLEKYPAGFFQGGCFWFDERE
jgi:rhodanese-related sulfurtransferase